MSKDLPPALWPRNSKKIHLLEPVIQGIISALLRNLWNMGWQPVIAEGKRTKAQQREKVRLGYSKTMNSRHLSGLAVDIIDRRWGWHGPCADKDHQFWVDLASEAQELGLFSGRVWRMKDVAHVELRK